MNELPYLAAPAAVAGAALFTLGLGFFMLHNIVQVRATQMAARRSHDRLFSLPYPSDVYRPAAIDQLAVPVLQCKSGRGVDQMHCQRASPGITGDTKGATA